MFLQVRFILNQWGTRRSPDAANFLSCKWQYSITPRKHVKYLKGL